MDKLDRACVRAAKRRRATYKAWQRDPSPETFTDYVEAFRAWEEVVERQAARQEIWQAQRHGRVRDVPEYNE